MPSTLFEQMNTPNKFRVYQWSVIAVGLVICLVSIFRLQPSEIDLRFLLLVAIAVIVTARITIQIPRVKGLISVSDTFVFLAILLFSREAATLLAAAEGLCSSVRFSKKTTTILFNMCVMACSTFFAVSSLRFLRGPSAFHEGYSADYIVALSILACLQYASNSGIVALGAALKTDQPFWRTWKEGFLWTSITYFAGAFAAGIVSKLIGTFGFYAFLATTPIIVVVYFTYMTYLKNIEASKSQAEQAERHVDALRESEERFRSAFDHAAGMALVAPDGRWIQVNRSLCEMLGYSEEELLAGNFQLVTHHDDLKIMLEQLEKLNEATISSLQLEQRYLHKDRQVRWVLLSVTKVNDAEKRSANLIFQMQDITDRKQAEEKLVHDAFHDALTGLPNRILFMDHLKQSMQRIKRKKHSPFAVLFLDFDRFKLINDSLGHLVGDQLLIAISSRLEASVRPGDTVARLGGDEFTILLEDLNSPDEAIVVVKRLLRNLAEPFGISDREVFITASVGVALSAAGYEKADDVLRDADTAMYRAKSLGKARYEVFDKTMHADARELLQIETDLWRALERKELALDYQPIVSLQTGRIAGFEALLRWLHPARGIVSPLEFISVAEETGLIVPIGQWVLNQACSQTREWQKRCPQDPPLYVSVNLSAKQFMQPDLIEQVSLALDKSGLNAAGLKLEITESMVMQNVESTTQMLGQLRALGVEISLDDFGTGYSSLSCLHRFPISVLKVDRSFVSSMTDNQEHREIVRTIIALARNLKMDVIAEGVETLDQATELRAMNCEYGQGYYFSKALNAENAVGFLATDSANKLFPPASDSLIDYEHTLIA
ncbi:MAG TPA: EAL domain-containing protein [Pyrinomonadaceae bacterium]|nr:EAL domain-containing protein [Pyrinomonadaceae bacterium]